MTTMFTGIITAKGKVLERTEKNLRFSVPTDFPLILGSSIAVNGVCLTVVELINHVVKADILAETWHRTNLGDLQTDDLVNLELPAGISGRLDGHIVQGHVDGTGVISDIVEGPLGHIITIKPKNDLLAYMVEKGSICVDGISLTITQIDNETFSFESIPHTWEITNLHNRQIGSIVNLEVDVLAKYVEKLIKAHLGK